MKLFLVLVCLAASTLAGVIHGGGGHHGGDGPAYHGSGAGYDGSGAGYGGSGAGYGGYYGPGAGYGSGGGYGGSGAGYGGSGAGYGGSGAGYRGYYGPGAGYGSGGGYYGGGLLSGGGSYGGAGGLGLGLNGGLGAGGVGSGGTGARGVVGVVTGGGAGGAAADGSRDWHLRANAARGTGARAIDNGRDNGGFGNAAARASARAHRANSAYGQNAADRNRDANAATYAAKLDAANAFDKRAWDGANHWNQGQRHRVLGRGNNWRQGRRKHDDIDYAYDKRFDLKDSENGGFVLAESDKKHALDHLRDRVGAYHRNLDKDAAHASAADAQKSQQNAAAFHNDAAHAANSDAFARKTANTAGNHGRNRDLAQKLDHSKGGSGRWDNFRRSASDVYKNLAADHGSFSKKGRGAYAPGGYGLGLAAAGDVAGKPGYGDGYSGYGGPYDGSGYVAAAPLVGPGHAGSGPIVGPSGPVVGHSGPVVGPGGLVGHGGSFVGGGGVVDGGALVRGAGYVSGGALRGPGSVLGGGNGLKAVKADQNSLRDSLRHSDDAAKAHSTRAQYNRNQRLLHRDRAFDHDRHNAAADRGQNQNSRQAAHAANKAAAAKAAAARAAQADRRRAAFNENLQKNEAEKYRLSDRDNDRKIFKRWFNNKRRGGDNYERLNFDRDHKDDVYGQHVTALKDLAQAGNRNQWNTHHDHRGRNAQNARVGANARDSHASEWSKNANGFQNADAATGAKDDSKRRGFYNRDFGRNQGRNAYDGRVQNAWQNHRGRSRSGLTGAARGVVGADAGIAHNGVGGNFGGGLNGVHGGGLGSGNGGIYGGSGYGGSSGAGLGGSYGSGLGGSYGSGLGGSYGSGLGGSYGNGLGGSYGKGLGGSGYGAHTGGHAFPGSGGSNPWKND